MEELYQRTELLIGEDNIQKLINARILVCGAGGVGGYVLEALARAGVGKIGIMDADCFSESNLNRQILATLDTIDRKKVVVAKERILSINPNCKVCVYDMFYLPQNSQDLDMENYDYVIDAIDTVTAKIHIIKRAKSLNIGIISSMGTGNKLNTEFLVDDIKNTSVCPLAKVLRKELKANGVDSLKVVYSKELPKVPQIQIEENGRHIPASISYTPAIAGFIIAGEVIKDIIAFDS